MRRLLILLVCLVGVTLGAQQPTADPPKPPERALAQCEAELVKEQLAHLTTKEQLADAQADGAIAGAQAADRGRILVKQHIAAERAKLPAAAETK